MMNFPVFRGFSGCWLVLHSLCKAEQGVLAAASVTAPPRHLQVSPSLCRPAHLPMQQGSSCNQRRAPRAESVGLVSLDANLAVVGLGRRAWVAHCQASKCKDGGASRGGGPHLACCRR